MITSAEIVYELARRYASDNQLNRVTVDPPGAWLGIAASGITYREVREALARLGLASDEAIAACGIRMIKMGMPLPFYPETITYREPGGNNFLPDNFFNNDSSNTPCEGRDIWLVLCSVMGGDQTTQTPTLQWD